MADDETPPDETNEAPDTDRRRQERTKIEVKRSVVARIEQGELGETACHLHLLDISQGGMKVNVDQVLELEAQVRLKFELSSLGPRLEGSFESVCRVVWTKQTPGGSITGLEFIELAEESGSRLEHILEFWSEKSSLNLTKLWKPINAKIRSSAEEPWSRTLFVQALSPEGFQFKFTDRLDEDQSLQSRLLLNDGPLVISARVLWCKETPGPFDVGLQFVDQTEEVRAAIRLHLKRTGNASFRK